MTTPAAGPATAESLVGLYAIDEATCPACDGDGVRGCEDFDDCPILDGDDCEYDGEHPCSRCRSTGRILKAAPIFYTALASNRVRCSVALGRDTVVAIVRHAERTQASAPRIVFDGIEPALRALAVLDELGPEYVARLFRA